MELSGFYNYIALFLTFRCNYSCPYCINWKRKSRELSASEWIRLLEHIDTALPITICGGEPSLHSEFFSIIKSIPQRVHLLTNLQFDPALLVTNGISPERFNSSMPFAPIRVSFHPDSMDFETIVSKMRYLKEHGFRAALYCIETEETKKYIEKFKEIDWLDFQTKPLLPNTEAESIRCENPVWCRTKEFLIDPAGLVFKCHRDLYKGLNPIFSLSDYLVFPSLLMSEFRECYTHDVCHPCDLKIKRDRFGRNGYKSIEQRKEKVEN